MPVHTKNHAAQTPQNTISSFNTPPSPLLPLHTKHKDMGSHHRNRKQHKETITSNSHNNNNSDTVTTNTGTNDSSSTSSKKKDRSEKHQPRTKRQSVASHYRDSDGHRERDMMSELPRSDSSNTVPELSNSSTVVTATVVEYADRDLFIGEQDLLRLKTNGIIVFKQQSFGKPHPIRLFISRDETELLEMPLNLANTSANSKSKSSSMRSKAPKSHCIPLKSVRQLLSRKTRVITGTHCEQRLVSIVYGHSQSHTLNIMSYHTTSSSRKATTDPNEQSKGESAVQSELDIVSYDGDSSSSSSIEHWPSPQQSSEQFEKFVQVLYYLTRAKWRPSVTRSIAYENGKRFNGGSSGNNGHKCIAGVPRRVSIESYDALGRAFDMDNASNDYSWEIKLVECRTKRVEQVADELGRESFVYTLLKSGSYHVRISLKDHTNRSLDGGHGHDDVGETTIMQETVLTVVPTDLNLDQCFIQQDVTEFCAGEHPSFLIIGRDLYGNVRTVDPSYCTVRLRADDDTCAHVHAHSHQSNAFTLIRDYASGHCRAYAMIVKSGNYTTDVYSTHNAALCIGSVSFRVLPSRLIDYSKSSLIILPKDCTIDGGGSDQSTGRIVARQSFHVHMHLYDRYDNLIADTERYAHQFLMRVRSVDDPMICGHDLYSAHEVAPTHFQVKVLWGGSCTVYILLRGDFEDNHLMEAPVSVMPAPGEDVRKQEFLLRMHLEKRSRMEQSIEYEVFSWSFGRRFPALLNEIIARYAPHLTHLKTDSNTSRERVLSVYKKLVMFVHPDRILHAHAPDSEEVIRLNVVFNTLQQAYQRYKGG